MAEHTDVEDIIRSRDIKRLRQVLEQGYDPNSRIVVASSSGEAEASVDWPVLTMAVMLGFHDGVTELVSRGADINARDANGQTALTCACAAPCTEADLRMVEQLVSLGADVLIKDHKGESATDIAAQHARYVVEHGLGYGPDFDPGVPLFVVDVLEGAGGKATLARTREALRMLRRGGDEQRKG